METNLPQKLMILQKNKLVFLFFLLLLTACSNSSPLEKTIKEVNAIDSQYGIKLSDYETGLTYFDTHERDVPVNQEELVTILSELDKIKQGKTDDALTYVNFRINLFEAEKFYKSASRRPFADYSGNTVRCSKEFEINLSINELFDAVNRSEEAIALYKQLNHNGNSLGMTPDWDAQVHSLNKDLIDKAKTTRGILKNYCNTTQSE